MSKAKGNAGELELCKKLKVIFDGSFIRVPNSGAFTGGKNSFRKEELSDTQIRNSKGDIIPPDFMPKLVLEAKWYKDFLFHQLIIPGGCPQLDEWIKQSLDAVDDGDVWYVVFKINRRGWFIAVPSESSHHYVFEGSHAIYTGQHGSFHVTEAMGFFENNREIILQLTK
jgi:hypothetical protein